MAELTTVPQINDLEKSILRSVRTAQREYEAMTDGWWLWHAPKSFLQVIVAQRVAKETKHVVYIDASMRRIERETVRGPGRRAKNAGQRPDILVWHKAARGRGPSATLRAVIEIKTHGELPTHPSGRQKNGAMAETGPRPQHCVYPSLLGG